MTSNLKQMRRRLLLGMTVLLLADAAVLLFLLSPPGRSPAQFEAESARLELKRGLQEREVAPLRGMEQKLARAKEDLAAFYAKRFPPESSAIAANLGRLAASGRVRISEVKYSDDEAVIGGLRRVKVQATLRGDYPDVMRFLNSLERDAMFLIIDGVTLKEQDAGAVTLDLRLETYFKTEG